MKSDMYFAFDIEADGPIPGPYSMLSIGLSVAGTFDGNKYTPIAPTLFTHYTELKPVSKQFDPEALAVSGLDRDVLSRYAPEPDKAMAEVNEFVKFNVGNDGEFRPVAVAWPLEYDWLWYYWYAMNFVGKSAFSFSSAKDMKTMGADILKVPLHKVGKRSLTKFLLNNNIVQVDYPHTHNALDDAIGTAELFSAMMRYQCSQ